MTLPELKDALNAAVKQPHDGIQLVSATHRAPFPCKGFPKGELLCAQQNGTSVWLYSASKLLAAIEKQETRFLTKVNAPIASRPNPVENVNPDSEPDGPVDTSFPFGHSVLEPLRESISKALANQMDASLTKLAGIPVFVKPELPPCTINMRGDVPEAHIETDSMETANALVECANANNGNITYEMLLEYYKKTLEHKPRFVGLDLSHDFTPNIPWRDTGVLHAKRKQIVADVAKELQDERDPVELCKNKFQNIEHFQGTPQWPESDDCTGEGGPAPRRLADGGEIVAPKDYIVGAHSHCDLFSYPRQIPATTVAHDIGATTGTCAACGRPVHSITLLGHTAWVHDSVADFRRCGSAGIPRERLPVQEPANPVETSNPNNRPTTPATTEQLPCGCTVTAGQRCPFHNAP